MSGRTIVLRIHAAKRMLQRGIRIDDVEITVETGEVIETYPDDTPFPSRLLLASAGGRVLHVVAADEPETTVTYVITAYYPDLDQWDAGCRRRRT